MARINNVQCYQLFEHRGIERVSVGGGGVREGQRERERGDSPQDL